MRCSLRRAAAGEGAEAMCSSARVGVGEGAEACSSINSGRPGALNWAAQWNLARAVGKRFRGCRAKRLYVHGRFRIFVPQSSDQVRQARMF